MNARQDEKCLRIRIEGKTPAHIKNAALVLGLCIVQVRKRGDGTYYGYGNTIQAFKTEEKDNG